MVRDLNPGTSNSSPILVGALPNQMIFRADTGSTGIELWKSDGTDGGTELIKDINPSGSSAPSTGIVKGDTVYFRANDGTNGIELWMTDGTAAGTKMVKDINPSGNSGAFRYALLRDTVYFQANDGTNGTELWKSDGADAGTVMVKDIRTGAGLSSSPTNLFNFKDTIIYFQANDGTDGNELWKSDGTEAGTVQVKDIRAGGAGGNPNSFIAFRDTVFFLAENATDGKELWKTDGTDAGTVMVKDINPSGTGVNSFVHLVIMNDSLFFPATNGTDGVELWVTDGTESGTVMLKDINPSGDSNPDEMVLCNGKLFFSADNGSDGEELWISDGTSGGTVQLKDIRAGATGSDVDEIDMVCYNNYTYFRARDGTSGKEPWRSDGTLAGTVMDTDVYVGSLSSSHTVLGMANNLLFMSIRNAANGTELWVASATPLPVELIDFSALSKGESVWIKWRTASEINNSHFIIERKSEGGKFEELARIPGQGNSSSTSEYLYEDKDPHQGISFYRLKQVDFDGKIRAFDPVTVYRGGVEILDVFPNPSFEEVQVVVNADRQIQVKANLCALDGKCLLTFQQRLKAGNNKLAIDVFFLPAGLYLFQITNGSRTLTQRQFVVGDKRN